MAAQSVVAGRFLVLILIASIIVSSATIYGYASNWYAEAALTGSIERNVSLTWNRFSLVMPADTNKTVNMTSEFEISNLAGTGVYATVFEQRLYLTQFAQGDFIGDYFSKFTTLILQGSKERLQANIGIPYSEKASLFEAASYSRTWIWINYVALTLEAGDVVLQICFLVSINNPPNATTTSLQVPSGPCGIPGTTGGGGPS